MKTTPPKNQYILFFLHLFILIIQSILIFSPFTSIIRAQDISDPASIKFKIFYPPIMTMTPSPYPTLPAGYPTITPPPYYPTPTPSIRHCYKIAAEAIQVTSNLQRGFWNYFNKSTIYPETWNQSLYDLNPNVCLDDLQTYPPGCTGTRPGPFDMFWCTWTPMKSYLRAGFDMPQDLYSTLTLKPWFELQSRYIPGDTPYNKLQIGSTVFFRLKTYTVTKHVAILTAVTQDYVTIYESNGGNFTRSLTVGLDGKIQDIGGTVIDGFGIPPPEC